MHALAAGDFSHSMTFFVQLAVILGTCRVVGLLVRRFGQPQVVGEMIAGVILGPSLFGLYFPSFSAEIFPRSLIVDGTSGRHPLLTVLYCLAQIGLVLYMFLVGLEYRSDLLKGRARSALSVSLAGVVVPFALGCVIAWFLRDDRRMFTQGVRPHEAMLYLGAAMSITAFPMLARIIHEAGLTGTSLGTLAITAGSADDAMAWCVLAVVLASFQSSLMIAVTAFAGSALFVLVVLLLVKPLLARFEAAAKRNARLEHTYLPSLLVLLMLSAWYTDRIGIYAVFGAFVLGLAVPRGESAARVVRAIEPLTVNLFLPLFFVNSGLNTRINLLGSTEVLGVTALIVLAACLGKGAACYGVSRLTGVGPRESFAIGAY